MRRLIFTVATTIVRGLSLTGAEQEASPTVEAAEHDTNGSSLTDADEAVRQLLKGRWLIPPVGDQLSDQQVAPFIRISRENNCAAVALEEVAQEG